MTPTSQSLWPPAVRHCGSHQSTAVALSSPPLWLPAVRRCGPAVLCCGTQQRAGSRTRPPHRPAPMSGVLGVPRTLCIQTPDGRHGVTAPPFTAGTAAVRRSVPPPRPAAGRRERRTDRRHTDSSRRGVSALQTSRRHRAAPLQARCSTATGAGRAMPRPEPAADTATGVVGQPGE